MQDSFTMPNTIKIDHSTIRSSYQKSPSMFSDYLGWAQAKKNKEELEKTNPKNPVLNENDEDFLHKVTSTTDAEAPGDATVISDDGKEKDVSTEDQAKAVEATGSTAVPESADANASDKVDQEQGTQEEPAKAEAGDDAKTAEKTAASKRTWAAYGASFVPTVSGRGSKVRFKPYPDALDSVTNSS